MSTSQAIIGPGFLVDYENPNTPGDWVHVIEVGDITGPAETTEVVDVTNQDSTGAYREKRATLQDGGTVTFPSHFIPSDNDQAAMIALKQSRTLLNWRIKMGTTDYYVFFGGIITGFNFGFLLAGVASMNVTITVSGAVSSGTGS